MKVTVSFLASLLCLLCSNAVAQYMPIVYDNPSPNSDFEIVAIESEFSNGDIVIGVNDGRQTSISWLNKDGISISTQEFEPSVVNNINKIVALDQDRALVVGDCRVDKGNKAERGQFRGVAMVISKGGEVLRRVEIGSTLSHAVILADGTMLLGGQNITIDGQSRGFLAKVATSNGVIYEYLATHGSVCSDLIVSQGVYDSVLAVFSGEDGHGGFVVDLDETGKPNYVTRFSDDSFVAEKMLLTKDQGVLVVGQGVKSGGTVIKLRKEGDIVFQKAIVPSSASTRLPFLELSEDGQILVGGNDIENAYFALLRSDGTQLTSSVDKGSVSDLTMVNKSGESAISIYDDKTQRGKIIKLSREGYKIFERPTATVYNDLRFNYVGDILMVSASSGRISQLSSIGEPLFDRYVTKNTPETFKQAMLPTNGSVILVGQKGRLVKLAHGVYISDITVQKPIHGTTNAVFTIRLSGFSFTKEGNPIPVSVKYATADGTAIASRNFDPVEETISFTPSLDGAQQYLSKHVVKVPVVSNNMLEGDRIFTLNLFDATNSYIIRGESEAIIKDQPAVVKLNYVTHGVEGGENIVYELGLYKTNGKALVNDTGVDIVIDGVYGKSTADELDYEKSFTPRVIIAPLRHSGIFSVIPIEDTRYESTKDVVIEFNKIYAMSDTDIQFVNVKLIATGELKDQPAIVSVKSLSNMGRPESTVLGLFKVSLLRARDGALSTNNSGGDIILDLSTDIRSSAISGVDYIFTNLKNARIWGDGTASSVNINGVILNTGVKDQDKTVGIEIKGVKAGDDAPPIKLDPAANKAIFEIKQ